MIENALVTSEACNDKKTACVHTEEVHVENRFLLLISFATGMTSLHFLPSSSIPEFHSGFLWCANEAAGQLWLSGSITLAQGHLEKCSPQPDRCPLKKNLEEHQPFWWWLRYLKFDVILWVKQWFFPAWPTYSPFWNLNFFRNMLESLLVFLQCLSSFSLDRICFYRLYKIKTFASLPCSWCVCVCVCKGKCWVQPLGWGYCHPPLSCLDHADEGHPPEIISNKMGDTWGSLTPWTHHTRLWLQTLTLSWKINKPQCCSSHWNFRSLLHTAEPIVQQMYLLD